MRGEYYLIYFLIGLVYWAFNLIVRKLHLKNESGDGWFLAPLWLFGWPLALIFHLIAFFLKIKTKINNKF